MFMAAIFLLNYLQKHCLLNCIRFPALLLNITAGPNNKSRYCRSHPTRSPIRHFAYYVNVGCEVPPTKCSRYEVPRKSVSEFES
jgi:hypothetical protein